MRWLAAAPSEDAGNSSAMTCEREYLISQRADLLEELHNRYGKGVSGGSGNRLNYARKKFLWNVVTVGSNAVKRGVDITGALFALMCFSPILAAVAIAIKVTDRGPVMFWQKRVGQWGQEFPFPKFRSMVVNAEQLKADLITKNDHENGITFKMKRDPRITGIGRITRKLSLDELPQLFCVLGGEMSLVGPRPPLPREVAQYSLLDRRRLDVKPGLTCIWQVSGRGDIPFDRQVQLDIQYIESQSIWLDLLLLLKTAPAIVFGKGAY
jgi:lipopolysaccharide/colanic/teichoic acid biosynthesis glycosyltransferase